MVLVVKNMPAKAGDIRDLSLIPVRKISPGERNGNPLQHCYLENPMVRGAWWAAVHGVTKNWTRLSDSHTWYVKLAHNFLSEWIQAHPHHLLSGGVKSVII